MDEQKNVLDKLTEITNEEIIINFIIDGEEYVVLNGPKDSEAILIAKVVDVDDNYQTIVSLTDEEYEKAFKEYISIIEDMEAE